MHEGHAIDVSPQLVHLFGSDEAWAAAAQGMGAGLSHGGTEAVQADVHVDDTYEV